MPKPSGFTKQLGIRTDDETIERCRIAGAGLGEVAGARHLLQLGWERYTGAIGLAGASTADRLRAIAAELDQQALAVTVAPSGAVVEPEPTAERIAAIRQETNAALIVTTRGLMVFGLAPDDSGEACLALDTVSGEIGLSCSGVNVTRKIGDAAPAVAVLAQLLAGVLGRTAETVAAGGAPEAAPAGRHERLGLTVTAAHPADGLSRIELGEATLCCHSLQITALCSELFALQARLAADSIGRRQALETTLSRTPSREACTLMWERTHGS